jgi:hypothetical protein
VAGVPAGLASAWLGLALAAPVAIAAVLADRAWAARRRPSAVGA